MVTTVELIYDSCIDDIRDSVNEIKGLASKCLVYGRLSSDDAQRLFTNISIIDNSFEVIQEIHRNYNSKA